MDVLTERTPRVVSAVKLHRAAERRKTGLFLAEGSNSVEAALATGKVTQLFCTEDALDRYGHLLTVPFDVITERAAKALGDTVTPPGIVAVCRQVSVPLATALSGAPKLVAVAAGISDPGNAGTLIRIADAVGADAVVFAGDAVDPHNGKCVRASAGSVFHIPIARERDDQLVVSALRAAGLRILATAGTGEVDLDSATAMLSEPTAWVFGNEAHGLDDEMQTASDARVRIPIRGRAESLNLATAAAICLYEGAKYQRR